ncbi:MAG: peptide chain release factor N(5)-glutamine methyltransferase [Verrucomicrobiota bacterium]
MHTLLEILRKSEELLIKQGIPEARLDAEHLIADTLGCQRMEIYLQFDRPMEEEVLSQLRPRLARRARREPLSYILEHQPFRNLHIQCGPGALIPRPETEELIEKVVAHVSIPPQKILDLGTGSGAIALSLKSTFPKAEVIGVDRSREAISLAQKNGDSLNLAVSWLQSSWFDHIEGKFDLIISNPPYLAEDEWTSSQPEVKDHEPKEALVSDKQGFADLDQILQQARNFLNDPGLIALETGINHREKLQASAKDSGYSDYWVEKDFSDRDRFFFARI